MRKKYFCFFIKPRKYSSYTRFEQFFLALRIGYFKEAWRLVRGKESGYVWEEWENMPIPFVFFIGLFLVFMI